MDVFSWSIPFLAEKVVSMLYTIVRKGCGDDEIEDDNVDVNKIFNREGTMSTEETKFSRGLIMKKKVKSVARMSKMFATLRYSHSLNYHTY